MQCFVLVCGECADGDCKFCVLGLVLKGRACAREGLGWVGGWAGFERLGPTIRVTARASTHNLNGSTPRTLGLGRSTEPTHQPLRRPSNASSVNLLPSSSATSAQSFSPLAPSSQPPPARPRHRYNPTPHRRQNRGCTSDGALAVAYTFDCRWVDMIDSA